MKEELWVDVLVIGGGGAALRAALCSHECGATTAVLSKKEAGRSGATYYSVAEVGAFNVPDGAMDTTDNADAFYADMENASLGMARLPLCRILAERAGEALHELEEMSGGTLFSKLDDGSFNVYQACFSTKPRSHVVENHFKPILQTLREAVEKTDILILNDVQAVDLLLKDGEVGGVLALDKANKPVVLHAKSVILATGGASRLFKKNMYPDDITGDGYAMAYRAGAQLTNMEFMQAGIGVAHTFINLFGNYLWAAFPRIRNQAGENILLAYGGTEAAVRDAITQKTHFPFSTRDASKQIEIAVQSEINRGHGTENGNVYLDFLETDFSALFQRNPIFASMWKFTYNWHQDKGIDFYKDPIEIACFAHAINGGVLINENAESTIPGLYAAGETAAGPHGADRLGGNMSVTCQVFGKIAGQAAAKRAKRMEHFHDVGLAVSQIEAQLRARQTGKHTELERLLKTLQAASDQALLIVRTEAGLQKYQATLQTIRKALSAGCHLEEIRQALQIENLVTTGEMIAAAALKRQESRGSHYREDYPRIDDTMEKNLMIQKELEMVCRWET